jgi:hypothetical protein
MRKPPTLANGDKEIPSGLSLHLGFDHRTLQHAVSGDAGGKRRDISFRVRRFAHIARGLLELSSGTSRRCRWLLARHGGFPHQGQRNNFRPVRCGVRRARAEVAAYADCTESQMMAMFGWTDPKMPAHYIAQANRERLGISGIEKMVTFDQSQSLEHWLTAPRANGTRTPSGNGVVTFPGNTQKKA